ncbi:MAG: hypothetical protein NVSMB52_04860 [Chloroflexota bacterium]
MSQALRFRVAIPVLLATFFLALYFVSASSDLLHNGDTDLRYQTTQALVEQHQLWIGHPMWTDSRLASGRGGHLYAFYAPGQTILMAPLYILGKVVAHHLSLPYDITTLYAARTLDLFLGSALAVLFYLFCLGVGYSVGVSVVLTLVFGIASVVWPDAQSALEQTQVSLFLLLATFASWMIAKGANSPFRWTYVVGSAVGLAFWTRYDAALYLPVFALFLLAVQRESCLPYAAIKTLGAFAGGVLPWAVFVATWNWIRFDSPFLTGLHEDTFGHPLYSGLLDLLVSPGKGLVWYLPLIFLLPFASRRFYRRSARLSLLFAALVAVPLLFAANLLYWHGDPSWGPRYLYPAVPYLILPLGEIFATWGNRTRVFRVIAAATVGCSALLQMVAVSVTQWRFWYHLQAMQQSTANVSQWSGEPFHWGSQHYHYYWNVDQSPILLQIKDVYQVARISLGDTRYVLKSRPATEVSSNPADNYPINTFSFWWTDTRHPLLGAKARDVLAAALALVAFAALALVLVATTDLEARKGRWARRRISRPGTAVP